MAKNVFMKKKNIIIDNISRTRPHEGSTSADCKRIKIVVDKVINNAGDLRPNQQVAGGLKT